MTTQAELWVRFLKLRTDNSLLTPAGMERIKGELASDYPHVTQILTSNGEKIGVRRVFNDRSIADQYDNDPGFVHIDVLTEGKMGTAHNGTDMFTPK